MYSKKEKVRATYGKNKEIRPSLLKKKKKEENKKKKKKRMYVYVQLGHSAVQKLKKHCKSTIVKFFF